MKENNTNYTNQKDKKEQSTSQLKKYKTPEFTVYGDISELVLANGGFGSDGGPAFASLT